MLSVALKMLMVDRAKFLALIFGIAFTAFLAAFGTAFFSGFMTRGFSLVSENPEADIWVMDPSVQSAEQTMNMTEGSLERVRGVEGVRYAYPLALGNADMRFPNGAFQPVQIIGVDDATLSGMPPPRNGLDVRLLRSPDAAFVSDGGTQGKLETPIRAEDLWPKGGPHLAAPTRHLDAGDEVEINDARVAIQGIAEGLPRFPPHPLLYTTFSNAMRLLPVERHRLTFVLVSVRDGASSREVAERIESQTGLRARTAREFKSDTVHWYLANSEDVGDVTSMLLMAVTVGFGVTGVMLFMFTRENQRQYAVLMAMGATSGNLLRMIFAQAGLCAFLGCGIGLGLCGLIGPFANSYSHFPFRLMWFAPPAALLLVLLISAVAAAISLHPVLKLNPASVFAGR